MVQLPETEKINLAFDALDTDQVEALSLVDHLEKVSIIAKLYRLDPLSKADVSLFSLLIITGLLKQDDLPELLATSEIPEGLRADIIDQMNTLILNPYFEKVEELRSEHQSIEETGSDIEILEEEPVEEEPVPIEETAPVRAAEEKVFADSDIIIEEDPSVAGAPEEKEESREEILEDLEHPPVGTAVDFDIPKETPVAAPAPRPAPVIFQTSTTPPPKVLKQEPLAVTENRASEPAPITEEAPKRNPLPASTVIINRSRPVPLQQGNRIPIEVAPVDLPTQAPATPIVQKEDIGPIKINIPESMTSVPVAPIETPTPVTEIPAIEEVSTPVPEAIVLEEPLIVENTEPQVFKDIPKVTVVDVEHSTQETSTQPNPLDDPETLKKAQDKLREIARANQNTFVSQKLATTFSLPKKETVISGGVAKVPPAPGAPRKSSDSYRERV